MSFKSLIMLSVCALVTLAEEESAFSFLTKCPIDGTLNTANCVAAKALKMVEDVAKSPKIEVFPGVVFTSDNPNIQRSGKELKELPVDPKERGQVLFDRLLDTTAKLISGRSLSIKLPFTSAKSVARALEVGRAKIKKVMGPLLLGIGAKVFGIMPIVIGAVALIATKALIIAKIAFILAVAIAFPALFSSGGGGIINKFPNFGGWGGAVPPIQPVYGPPQWTTNQIGGGPYARSIDVGTTQDSYVESAQELAYSSQKA